MSDPANCPECADCCTDLCVGGEIRCVYSCGCCCPIPVRVAPSKNLVAGTIIAQRQADGFWDAFDPQATNGLQFPRAVLRFDTVTDERGFVTNFPSQFNGFAPGCGPLTTIAWVCGTFRIEETSGNLPAALTHPGFGRLIEGFIGGAGIWKLL